MSALRKSLQDSLCRYSTDTLGYIHTVKSFCETCSKWILCRETELQAMMDIMDRVDQFKLSLTDVTKSENKGEAFLKYMKNVFKPATSTMNMFKEWEKELAEVLRTLLEGLEKLDCFLDAVEKLSVTSLQVFVENDVLRLPEGVTLDGLQAVITAVAYVSPGLLEFKDDREQLFKAKINNVQFLACNLNKYIQTTKIICKKLNNSFSCDLSLKMNDSIEVHLHEDLPEDYIQVMLDHIHQLDDIRMDQDFRMAFLFQQETGQRFVDEFKERQPRMLTFLTELENTVVQLSRMHTGAKISNVAGSSVGLVGGVLSIVGLALIPVTAGVSLGLTMTGLGLGITSGVNSAVTALTEIGVNATQQKKAKELFNDFLEDVKCLQECVEQASSQITERLNVTQVDVAVGVGRVICTSGGVIKNIDALVDASSAVKLLKTEDVVSEAGKALVQEATVGRSITRVASDVPDVGQVAAKSTLALSKSARVGLIAVNALFVGLDAFIICKESISLAKGCQSEAAQFIGDRVDLWRSVMGSWQQINDSLSKALPTVEKKEAMLNTPFYLKMETKEPKRTETLFWRLTNFFYNQKNDEVQTE